MSAVATIRGRLATTLGRELLVGVTGIMLVGFILIHLSGNLLIFGGPEVFNAYAARLHSLGALLWVARIGLITVFIVHISAAISLAKANRAAREERYDYQHYVGRKSPASRLMLFSGLCLLFFLFFHINDFTLRSPTGPRAEIGGEALGLYGLVWNSFANPLRSLFYFAAMACLGMHLSHAIASVVVTLGALREKATPNVDLGARIAGAAIALLFSTIPLYVLIRTHLMGGQG